mmetsp:Transcript_53709/g.150015  ORF Transcript_53709/g.150015 Transcript_53709/m.150015 type:complete len:331 (+) Transcript_53709:2161-3153(+)
MQHPVRSGPAQPGVPHHRGQRAPVAEQRAGVEGDRVPACVRRCEAGPGRRPGESAQQRHKVHHCLLRAEPRLRRREGSPLGPAQILDGGPGGRQLHEERGRSDVHRAHVRGDHPEGFAHGRRGLQGLRLRALRPGARTPRRGGHRALRRGGVDEADAFARVGDCEGLRTRHGRGEDPRPDADRPLVPFEVAAHPHCQARAAGHRPLRPRCKPAAAPGGQTLRLRGPPDRALAALPRRRRCARQVGLQRWAGARLPCPRPAEELGHCAFREADRYSRGRVPSAHELPLPHVQWHRERRAARWPRGHRFSEGRRQRGKRTDHRDRLRAVPHR